MLQRAAVLPGTLSLLKELMDHPELKDFYLVGGTALALQIGHRDTIDIDLFSDQPLDFDQITSALPEDYMEFSRSKVFFGVKVDGVKCDFVSYPFSRQLPLLVEEGIRMAQPLEIAAMKLWAITRRGAKKDFWDLYFLLKMHGLPEIMKFFVTKFPNVQPLMVARSLSFFDDADRDLDPMPIIPVEWEIVKAEIRKQIKSLLLNR